LLLFGLTSLVRRDLLDIKKERVKAGFTQKQLSELAGSVR
jgi:hypothetical protein